jgi:thymidylate synthase
MNEPRTYYGETGYIRLLKDVLMFGESQVDRTRVGTLSLFDAKIIYTEEDFNCFSTVRNCPLKFSFHELWFFLRGETDTKKLEAKGINFWKHQTSREFLDKRGLGHLQEGNLGVAYSKQFRDYGGAYGATGEDQLSVLLDTLTSDPFSRRMMVDLWNPAEHHLMPLTPCWFNFQVVVIGDYLHMKLRNRSLDAIFGFSFAVQQYRLLQFCLCEMFGYKLGRLSADLSHVHIYNNQIDYAYELVERSLGVQGELILTKELNNLDDLLSLDWGDFEVADLQVNNTPFSTPKPTMAV